eukprot:gene41722-53080_t
MRAAAAAVLIATAPLRCAGLPDCVHTVDFDPGYGGCQLYAAGGSNNQYCADDWAEVQGVVVTALEACPGCGACVGATPCNDDPGNDLGKQGYTCADVLNAGCDCDCDMNTLSFLIPKDSFVYKFCPKTCNRCPTSPPAPPTTTSAPITSTPASAAPMTAAPASVAPVTAPPTTDAPSDAPTSAPAAATVPP